MTEANVSSFRYLHLTFCCHIRVGEYTHYYQEPVLAPYYSPTYGNNYPPPAPSSHGGYVPPSYFEGFGGDKKPSSNGAYDEGHGGGYEPSGGYAPPYYFEGFGGDAPSSYGGNAPSSYGGQYYPSAYGYHGSYPGYGAPQETGYNGGYLNNRPKPSSNGAQSPQPVDSPEQAPVNFQNQDAPALRDFRIPGAPAIAPTSPIALAVPAAPAAPVAAAATTESPTASIAPTALPTILPTTFAPVSSPTVAPFSPAPTAASFAPTTIVLPTTQPTTTSAPVVEPTEEFTPSMGSEDMPTKIVTGPDSAPSETPDNQPSAPFAPAQGAKLAPSEVSPTIVSSKDFPSFIGSEDLPTKIVTGPDSAPSETPVIQPPAPIAPALGPTLVPSIAPAQTLSPALSPFVITPAMTPNILTPSFLMPFTPSFFTPVDLSAQPMAGETLFPVGAPALAPAAPAVPKAPVAPTATSVSTKDSFSKDVDVEPFAVRFIGDIQLTEQVTQQIIKTIDELIAPYLMNKIGEELDYIDLQMKLLEDESKNITSASNGRQLRELESLTTMLIEISGSLDLEGATEEDLAEWDEQQVTAAVKSFFTGEELKKLLTALKAKGLNLQEIMIHDGNTDSLVTDEDTTTQSSDEGGDDNNKKSKALIASLVCGGFVFVTLAAALYFNSRRRRNKLRNSRELLSMSENDSLNLRSGKDELPDCNASASHVSFPHLSGDPDEDVDGEMDSDTLHAIKGTKKEKSKRDDFKSSSSFTSISIGTEDNKAKGKKKKKSSEDKNMALIATRQPSNGDEDEVYLSPLDL